MTVADAVSWVLIVGGGAFIVIGAIGMIRMPDFFTRQHAAGITDTAGAGLLVLGLIVQAGFTLVAFKLVLVVLFLFFTGPTATHALAQAALGSGLVPLLRGAAREPPEAPPQEPQPEEPQPEEPQPEEPRPEEPEEPAPSKI